MAKGGKQQRREADGAILARIAAALERLAPPPIGARPARPGDAFVWEPAQGGLIAVAAGRRMSI